LIAFPKAGHLPIKDFPKLGKIHFLRFIEETENNQTWKEKFITL